MNKIVNSKMIAIAVSLLTTLTYGDINPNDKQYHAKTQKEMIDIYKIVKGKEVLFSVWGPFGDEYYEENCVRGMHHDDKLENVLKKISLQPEYCKDKPNKKTCKRTKLKSFKKVIKLREKKVIELQKELSKKRKAFKQKYKKNAGEVLYDNEEGYAEVAEINKLDRKIRKYKSDTRIRFINLMEKCNGHK